MLKTILLVVAAVIAALPDKVFALINDLRQFSTWNPFAKMDSKNVITYDAVTTVVGGAYRWQGEKSGAGRMQITAPVPAQRVTAKLDFSKPFEAHNRVDFTVQAQGDKACTVNWTMHGPMPYLNRLMTLFFDMDKTVGREFEAGLANLKALAETT